MKNVQVSGAFFSSQKMTNLRQTSILIEDESVEGSMSGMSRDEKLVLEMQIPFTGEVFHCYSVATLMNIEYQ